jgi:hypothetical protein
MYVIITIIIIIINIFFSPAVCTWFAMRIVIVTDVFHYGLLANWS